MPDGVGQVDHLTLEDRPQSPVPPPVVGHEPHLGSRSIRRCRARFPSFALRMPLPGISAAANRRSRAPWPRLAGARLAWRPAPTRAGRSPRERRRSPMAEKFRITYATMSADNEELQAAYDAAAERARAELGKEYPVVVNGEERWRDEKYDEPSPIDEDIVIGRFSQATHQGRGRRRGRREGVPARVGPHGLAGAGAHPAQRGRHHGGARLRPRGADGLRGRQEPPRGARRRAGDRGADPLELRRDGEARRLPGADERPRAPPATTTTSFAPTASGP